MAMEYGFQRELFKQLKEINKNLKNISKSINADKKISVSKSKFDWNTFHNWLDKAVANQIEAEGIMPSKTSIMELARYSSQKKAAKFE